MPPRKTPVLQLLLAVSLLVGSAGTPARTSAQSKSKAGKPHEHVLLAPEREYLAPLGTADSPLVVGAKVDVLLQTGKRLDDQEITEIQSGKSKTTFRSLGLKSTSGKRQKLRAGSLSHLIINGNTLYVAFDPSIKDSVLIDLARRDEIVSVRLQAAGRQRWKPTDTEGQQQALAEYKRDYIDRVQQQFADRKFQVHETQFYLFCTDMPEQQIGVYVANLDRMYAELCKMFGVPKGTNIWRGKCVVVAFQEKGDFVRFERQIMDYAVPDAVQGLCHSFSNGKVVISCYRGNSPAFLGNLLVHETTHGFLHLFRSNVNIPPWLNEGLAEWVANVVVPESQTVPNRQRDAIPRIQTTGSMGGLLDETKTIESWQYGIASGLAQFLIDLDSQAFGGLFTLIKEGASWREALQELYGMTPQQLAAGFGRTVGIAELKP
ncbi:MAG: hypothetical protein JSS02_32660 [Planctomycetes bacterium]|nr:hypothetical protein [Planctomycetota bacterium]